MSTSLDKDLSWLFRNSRNERPLLDRARTGTREVAWARVATKPSRLPFIHVIPNVLAARYASPELVRLWSPENKIVLERRLWLAVLRAQRDQRCGCDDS